MLCSFRIRFNVIGIRHACSRHMNTCTVWCAAVYRRRHFKLSKWWLGCNLIACWTVISMQNLSTSRINEFSAFSWMCAIMCDKKYDTNSLRNTYHSLHSHRSLRLLSLWSVSEINCTTNVQHMHLYKCTWYNIIHVTSYICHGLHSTIWEKPYGRSRIRIQ